MLRNVFLLVLAPLTILIASCAKKDATPNGGASSNSVRPETIQPTSGGEMVLIPAGQFTMGNANGGPDQTPHGVRVSSFYMDRFLVTQEMYERVTGTNPSKWKFKDNPVEQLQWHDAAKFCNLCSELDGLAPCYDLETWDCDYAANGYRLPTEAEWEYACRARSQTRFSFGDDPDELKKYGWCKPLSRGRPRPVGKLRPNAWDLYDMHGNVWQWCNDFYGATYYDESPGIDPTGPATGKQRVLRGGSWKERPEACESANRQKEFPAFTDACFGADSYGFRRVRPVTIKRPEGPVIIINKSIAPPIELPDAPTGKSLPDEMINPPLPDGTIDPARLTGTIIFVSDRGGSLDIWRMRPDGTNLSPLTDDSHPDADPRFSPDGRQILYTSLRDGFPVVWLMDRNGANPRRVTDGSQASWSPDGKSIVLIRDDQVFVRSIESESERRITPDGWNRCGVPAWSPDGSQIALASRHEGEIGIYVVAADDPAAGRKLATEAPCCTPAWSEDGSHLLFQTVQGHIHELNLKSGGEEQLSFGADIQHDARYSPDGTLVVFCRAPTTEGPWQLCILDLDSDDLEVMQVTRQGSNRLPDWHARED